MATAAHSIGRDRVQKRTRVLMTGILFTPNGVQKVRIRNISRGGAQVLTESAVPRGCDAIFKRGAIFAAVHVAWSDGHEVGLKFYRQLSAIAVQSVFNSSELSAPG